MIAKDWEMFTNDWQWWRIIEKNFEWLRKIVKCLQMIDSDDEWMRNVYEWLRVKRMIANEQIMYLKKNWKKFWNH